MIREGSKESKKKTGEGKIRKGNIREWSRESRTEIGEGKDEKYV